jgi:acyl-coenzyme A synthetase/AMP-(fatty) acid ligase
MYILYEDEVSNDISKLEQAWSDRETFVFMSRAAGVSEEWVKKGVSIFPEYFQEEHFILLTSGSTGQPKLVVGSKKRSENLATLLHELQQSESAERTVVVLPLIYCYAFVNQWVWSKVKKRELVLTHGFKEPDKLIKILLSTQNAMLCLTGSQIRLFKNTVESNTYFPGIIRLHFAGGQFPQNESDIIKRYFPNAKVFNNYGCAEAMPRLTLRSIEESEVPSNIGKPLPGVELKTEEGGEIFFRSRHRAVGFYDARGVYIPRDEEWIPSGDLGEEVANGYWRINGRNNDVFKRHGEKISLFQLLITVQMKWPGSAEFYREKDKSGEDGHVLVVSQIREILISFRERHPRPHWPIRFESVSNFPTSPNGKIDKIALQKIDNKTTHWEQRI